MVSYPAIDQLPSTVVVEETRHDEFGEPHDLVQEEGYLQAHKLYTQERKADVPYTDRNESSSKVDRSNQNSGPRLNFGEHRKGVITPFDWRNYKVLNPTHETGCLCWSRRAECGDQVNQRPELGPNEIGAGARSESRGQSHSTPVLVGVQQVYDLVHNDIHGGLGYYYLQTADDPSTRTPVDRGAYLYWLCYQEGYKTTRT